jgi:hypothetical protein
VHEVRRDAIDNGQHEITDLTQCEAVAAAFRRDNRMRATAGEPVDEAMTIIPLSSIQL